MIRFAILLAMLIQVARGSALAAEVEFNRDIRPILAENCFYCHGQDANQRQADLRLDDRAAAIAGGAIVPGDVEASELIARILSDDADTLMPPTGSNRHLSAVEKQRLRKWIADGAPFQDHWAFVAPKRPDPPLVDDDEWPRGDIDRFVLAKLESEKLLPSGEADRATLIRRLHADLVGLPPTPDEVDSFVEDKDPRAYENLVNRLLASPHFGERLALPWLDAARYADSNGFQQEGDTWQWMWRDWVVKALNNDMPFDEFTIWQLAGDLLPDATNEQKIASGFNRNHMLNGEGGAIAEEQRFNILFDRMDTTATTWLGLTMACSQCHDHKYDPITQVDYYRMMDAFNRVPETGTPQFYSSRIRVGKPILELPTKENAERITEFESQISALEAQAKPMLEVALAAWKAGLLADGDARDTSGLPESLRKLLAKPTGAQTEADRLAMDQQMQAYFDENVRGQFEDKIPQLARIDNLRTELANYTADRIPRVMVMSDAQPRQTHVLDRGAYLSPLQVVTFATPEFLPPLPKGAPANRLGLAQWLVSPTHPLTARVQVNRIWQHFFGHGIVKTAEDFGVQSEFPIHKDLLDWLAVEFREKDWSMKHLIREIVTSATYRQQSRIPPELLQRDPENRLHAQFQPISDAVVGAA